MKMQEVGQFDERREPGRSRREVESLRASHAPDGQVSSRGASHKLRSSSIGASSGDRRGAARYFLAPEHRPSIFFTADTRIRWARSPAAGCPGRLSPSGGDRPAHLHALSFEFGELGLMSGERIDVGLVSVAPANRASSNW